MTHRPVAFFPPWKQALALFRQQGFEHGRLVPDGWLWSAFGIEQPTDDTPKGVADKAELQFLGQFETFRAAVLEQDQKALVRSRADKGYQIIPPSQQTAWAEGEARRAVAKAAKQLTDRLSNVDHGPLSADQRRANVDALGRAGMLKVMTRQVYGRARLLPAPAGDEEVA